MCPAACTDCGSRLSGEDPNPKRHQVTDLPPVKPIVTEHQVHTLQCGVRKWWRKCSREDGMRWPVCLWGFENSGCNDFGRESRCFGPCGTKTQQPFWRLRGISPYESLSAGCRA
ncbi:MAG: IS66 family transposase zinc-finger binding domain-containing protein [Planctomycetia bacterium]